MAHSKADQENDADYDTARKVQLADNRRKAQRLGKDALRDLHLQKEEEEERRSGPLKARRQALDVEAVRSSYIISLPPVSYIQSKETAKEEEPPKVMLFDKSTLFQTEYAIKHKIVEEVSSPKVIYAKGLDEMAPDKFRSYPYRMHVEQPCHARRKPSN